MMDSACHSLVKNKKNIQIMDDKVQYPFDLPRLYVGFA